MKLKPFIKSDRIVIGLKDGDRRSVLAQLIQPIDDGTLDDPGRFLNDLIRREDELTTVMENGVAFPHARSVVVRRLFIVIGIVNDGSAISFGPDPDIRSKLFFCIGVPAFAPTAHIPLLQALANYVQDENRVEKIVASRIPSEVVKRLSTFKG